MNERTSNRYQAGVRQAIDAVSRTLSRHLRCRQCGERASWWQEVCQNCGAAEPVRLPIKWLAYSVSLLIASGILILVLT
jgi:ribosomal protein L37E